MESLSRRDKEKQAHEIKIVAAAERIFCQKGYEDAGMDEISREAQFTKRTVYQYFENKDELFFAVAVKILKKLAARLTEDTKGERSGYDKLEKLCFSYFRFCRENPVTARLISNCPYIQSKSGADGKNSKALAAYDRSMSQIIEGIIIEGKNDGSINSGTDTRGTAVCLLFMMRGFYSQLAASDEIWLEYLSHGHEDAWASMVELAVKPMKKGKAVTATRKGTA
jgi:Transcriptional regulator